MLLNITPKARNAASDYNAYHAPEHRGYGRPQMEQALDTFCTETGLPLMAALIVLCVLGGRSPAALFPTGYVMTPEQTKLVELAKAL